MCDAMAGMQIDVGVLCGVGGRNSYLLPLWQVDVVQWAVPVAAPFR